MNASSERQKWTGDRILGALVLWLAAAHAATAGGLTLRWEERPTRDPQRSSTWLYIEGGPLAAPIEIHYLEAYCRADSTDADWVKQTVIGHQTQLLSMSEDRKQLRLRCTLADGVVVDHTITAGDDEVDFRLEAHNPTDKRSEAHWAQPCVRVGEFTGTGPQTTDDKYAYIRKSFIFVDGKLTRMPTDPWATEARYTPGQVWCPAHVPRSDVNPRPLSSIVPSNGLIGCFSADERLILAIAWEPYQELFQGVGRCLHSDFRLGGLMPGQRLAIRGKLYIVPNDVEALVARYERDFPEHRLATPPYRITTVAGNGDKRRLGQPFGVEVGPDAALYICEVENHRIHRLDLATGKMTVVAGSGAKGYAGDGGPATEALLNEPYEVRFDRAGNMYFVEMQNHVVRRVDRQTGRIETVAGTGQSGYNGAEGPATRIQLNRPHSIALDDQGYLYIADIGNHRIRRVHLATGQLDTIAGNGQRQLPQDGQPAKNRPVLGPRALAIDGRTLWVALREGHSLWKMDLDRGIWWHVAGTGQKGYSGDGGPARAATLNGPKGVALDRYGNVYLADTENQVIRRVHVRTGIITTVAGQGPDARGFGGDGGPAEKAQFDRPHGICVAADGTIFVGDTNNHRVRQIKPLRSQPAARSDRATGAVR